MSNNSADPLLAHQEGRLFIISAPAGTGKTTLVSRLVQELPLFITSISTTTRTPRQGEINGKDYFFVTVPEFQAKITTGQFLEYVKLYDDYYGTSIEWVKEQLKKGRNVILVIDTQGAKLLRAKIPIISIFIYPPSLAELKQRLLKRGTETEKQIENRLAQASTELIEAPHYDYQVLNDNLENAYQELKQIFLSYQ